MHFLDYLVLAGYFAILIVVGFIAARRVHRQEDFFMGGRSFGKLLQTFAAFGAGTGSSDPVNTARTTFTSGMSGMWSVMYWLFVTPFYWISGVWYRRMRHLTLGDWFVERYESKSLGLGYAIFGILFYAVYGSMLFSAIAKFAAPLIGADTVDLFGYPCKIEYVLVPTIALVVLIYGIAGGLEAAYFTDLLQGLCIILLSVILVPFGLAALVERFDPESSRGMWDGFRIIHEQLPPQQFHVVGTTSASEFTLPFILAVILINLIGVHVQPHFIATGGGSAKTETDARVGLVTGNFLKRFCTVGWVLTALIALALFADHPELVNDPDRTWGVASRELLGPGLRGLMLACLLAALMSSIDAYMVVGSALVVRNIYAAYFNPNASEKQYLLAARITGALIVIGAVLISLFIMDVFEQLQLTWVFPVLFAAPFWVGMFWRRATRTAAWISVAFCALTFFVIPFSAPRMLPQLRDRADLLTTNRVIQRITQSLAAPADVAKRRGMITWWEAQSKAADALDDQSRRQARLAQLGPRPTELSVGDPVESITITGGKSIFWGERVKPVDDAGNPLPDVTPQPIGEPVRLDENTTEVELQYPAGTRLKGFGNLKLEFFIYKFLSFNLSGMTNARLGAWELLPKIISPFLVMILFSCLTRPTRQEVLDRYYSKMKTPVDPDVDTDRANLQRAFENVKSLEQRKLFPNTSLEFQKPTFADVAGFVICFVLCFAIIGLAIWVASIGG